MDSGDTLVPGATYLSANPMRLVRGTELPPTDLPLDYTVGFTITPKELVGEWANIIHVSATGNNCCNYGDRIPGIWFYANTYRFHIRDGSPSEGNAGCDPTEHLTQDVATAVRVEFRAFMMEVYYDDVKVCEAARMDGRTTHANARIWLPDDWHAAAEAIVDDVYILPLPPVEGCMTRGACNYDSAASIEGSCDMPEAGKDCNGDPLYVQGIITMFAEETTMVQQAEPMAIINLPLDYAVEFDIKPTAAAGGWANIIHFTTDSNCCAYGQRIPGVWFYGGTTRLHIRDGRGSNGNDGCDPAEQLPLNEVTNVRMVMTADKLEVFYNGESKCSGDRGDRTNFDGIKVYATDPWHEVAAGSLQNLRVITMDSGDTLVPGATYFTANPVQLVRGTEMQTVDLALDYDVAFTFTPKARSASGPTSS